MGIYTNVEKLEDKLSEILARNNLLFKLQTDKYPITLTVSQNQDVGAQMELYSNADGSVSSMDSVLRLIYKLDAVEVQTSGRLVISEDLMARIKSTGKKLYNAYLQAFFAEQRGANSKNTPDPSSDNNDVEEEDTDFDEFYEDDEEPDGED